MPEANTHTLLRPEVDLSAALVHPVGNHHVTDEAQELLVSNADSVSESKAETGADSHDPPATDDRRGTKS